jgi:hypothetical protein
VRDEAGRPREEAEETHVLVPEDGGRPTRDGMTAVAAAPAPVTPPLDTLTVARSWHGRPQTKRIGRDRQGRLVKRGFAKEKLYTFEQVPVFGSEDLAATLEAIARDRHACVVRGTPIPGSPADRGRYPA